MGVKTIHPPQRGITPRVVLLSMGMVLARSSSTLTKATGTGIVTWCLISLLRRGVLRDE